MNQPTPEWRDLSPDEKDLLENLLKTDFPGRDALAKQAEHAKVRMIDGPALRSQAINDHLEFNVGNEHMAEVIHSVPVEAGCKDTTDGMTIHALLHVFQGVIREIEFYKDDLSPILRMPPGKQFKQVFFQTPSGVEYKLL